MPTEKCPLAVIRKKPNAASAGTIGTINYNFIAKANYLSYTRNNPIRMDLYFTNSSRTLLLWDSWWPPNWGTTPYMSTRHSGCVNMAFLDGHVETIPGSDGRLYKGYIYALYRTGTPDPSTEATGLKLARDTPP